VDAGIGLPNIKSTVGPKKIYVYEGMKVIFKDGKVSDVQ
jgi:hypothetical protein